MHVGDAGQGREHAVIPARDVREPEDVQGLAREGRGRSPHGLVPQRFQGQPAHPALLRLPLQPPTRTEEREPQGALPCLHLGHGPAPAVPPACQHLGARAGVFVEERGELRGELGAPAVDRVRLRAGGEEIAAHGRQLASAEEALVVEQREQVALDHRRVGHAPVRHRSLRHLGEEFAQVRRLQIGRDTEPLGQPEAQVGLDVAVRHDHMCAGAKGEPRSRSAASAPASASSSTSVRWDVWMRSTEARLLRGADIDPGELETTATAPRFGHAPLCSRPASPSW